MAVAELASFGDFVVSCEVEGVVPPCLVAGGGVATEIVAKHGSRRTLAFETFMVWFDREALKAVLGGVAHEELFAHLVVLRLRSLVTEYGVRAELDMVRVLVNRACDT